MTLAEFCKKRREELGLNWNDIIDGGIANNTWCNIVNGKQLTVKPATMEKLARLLDCTKGDLQACMAETPNPLRKEAEKPEGQAGISITVKPKRKPKRKPKPEAPAPDPEEPAETFEVDEPEEEAEEMAVPVYHSVYEEDRQEGEERYKQKLRDMCLRIFASGIPGVHTMEKIYADIGYALVKELAEGGETDEAL